MTAARTGPEVKYELLEENKRTAVKTSHLWSAVLLAILVVCSSVIAFYMTWMHVFNTPKINDDIDFLMFGPKRARNGMSWRSNQRGELYAEAIVEMSKDTESPKSQVKASVLRHVEPPEYKRVCYYNLASTGTYHTLTPDMLSADLCTHINIAFATVRNGTIQPTSPSDIQGYEVITALKKVNPALKVMISVEWFTSDGEFAWIVASPENRTRFVEDSVRFLKTYDLDGLDLDWEFPSWPTEVPNQTDHFMDLLQLMSERFRQEAEPLLLSVAAGAPKPIIDRSYNITAMAQYIDFVNVMAYDYHIYQPYLPVTGANAPLYMRQAEKGYFTTLNLNWTAAYWLYKGMPAEKIIIGIPTYGHSYTLINEENHTWEAPTSGIGSWGNQGFVAYFEVCKFMGQTGAKSVFDYESKVPYAYKDKEWISFDNEQSVAYKAEFVKEHQFGGVMIFSLNTDDVEGDCGGATKFPLTERVKNVLQDDQL